MRQDPDVILIGEIRDAETAEIAIQSALTGHLVLTTLHTNDAPSAITRLIDMGMEDYPALLHHHRHTGAATGAGRLSPLPGALFASPGHPERDEADCGRPSGFKISQVKGCEKCSNTGYWGRHGIFEFLKITDDIQKLILEKKDSNVIKEAARKKGMRTLREDGWLKVKQGVTTIPEVLRVTQEEEAV